MRIYLSPKRVAYIVLAFIAIVDGSIYYHSHEYKSQIPDVEAQVSRLANRNRVQSFKNKHPKIRKTVPSAFKKMMTDGKIVSNAEDQLIKYSSIHHTTKLNMSNLHVQHESNVLKQYISGAKLTDGDAFNNPWTNHVKDTVRLVPGASNMNGTYSCAFIISNPKTHSIDNILAGDYDSVDRQFENMVTHNTDSVTDKEQTLDKLKHKKPSKKQLQKMKKRRAQLAKHKRKHQNSHQKQHNRPQKRGRKK